MFITVHLVEWLTLFAHVAPSLAGPSVLIYSLIGNRMPQEHAHIYVGCYYISLLQATKGIHILARARFGSKDLSCLNHHCAASMLVLHRTSLTLKLLRFKGVGCDCQSWHLLGTSWVKPWHYYYLPQIIPRS